MKKVGSGSFSYVFETLDGICELRRFQTLEKAREAAQEMLGRYPTIGTSYAVGDWGDQKITGYRNCTVRDLFPDA